MNKTQLQQKIVDMEKQLTELKKELEKKDKGIWKPKIGERYCFIETDAEINDTFYTEHDIDERLFAFGNYYKTKEEAQKMSNYLKYTNLLRKYVEEHSEPIDWEDSEDVFWITYNCYHKKIVIDCLDTYPAQGTIYASSEEALRDAIAFVGEDNIKKYIFGIEE